MDKQFHYNILIFFITKNTVETKFRQGGCKSYKIV